MSEPEPFLGRWSRLKQAERQTPPSEPATAAALPAPEPEPEPLPSLESLNALSDYTAFLRPKVPEGMQIAALRRAWTSDPVIAEFRGLADYDWDFNAPGYGLLRASDDLVELTRAVFARIEPEPASESGPPPAVPAPTEPLALPASPVIETARGPEPADVVELPRRRHGGALPD